MWFTPQHRMKKSARREANTARWF